MHVAQLEKDKEDLTAEVESLKNVLVVKDNRYTIGTYERDALLRELSQQLFDSKEEIELLRRRVREYERGRQMESKQQRGRTVSALLSLLN
jgi:predicted RNase H-like nuclease (RuvC/YqgF family)